MSDERTIKPNAPADFTPQLGDYKTLQPFRYWCQKVLPLVYDDSLSYYELLCKVVDYLNKTMEDVETLHGDVTNLHTAYDELQSYVNSYFSSLDVQEEINNKLDNMSKDGTLITIIKPFIPPVIVNWLTEHITETGVTDKSLLIENASAESYVTGSSIKTTNILTFFPVNLVDGWINNSGDVEPHANTFCQSITQTAINNLLIETDKEYEFFVTIYGDTITRSEWVSEYYISHGTKYRLSIRHVGATETNIEYVRRNTRIYSDDGNTVLSSKNKNKQYSMLSPFISDVNTWYNRTSERVNSVRLPLKNCSYYEVVQDTDCIASIYLYKSENDTEYLYYNFGVTNFYVPTEYHYVEISVMNASDTKLTPYDVIKSKLNLTLLYDTNRKTQGIVSLNPSNWRIGTILNGEPSESDKRLSTINFIPLEACVCLYLESNISVAIEFYNLKKDGTYNYISSSNFNKICIQPPYNANAIKVILNNDNNYVTLNTLNEIDLKVIPVKSQIRVTTFNCGLYYDGVTPVPDKLMSEYYVKWVKAIGELNPDIIMAQEAGNTMNVSGTQSANVMWNHLLNYYHVNQSNRLGSRFTDVNNTYVNWAGDTSRGINSADYLIEGVPIHVMSVHLSIEQDASVNREAEIQKIIEEMDKYPIVICGGDFNTFSENELKPLKAKYTVLNTGDFGNFNTWKGSSSWEYRCLDNIVVKGLSASMVTVGDYKISDHEPLSAVLNFRTVTK